MQQWIVHYVQIPALQWHSNMTVERGESADVYKGDRGDIGESWKGGSVRERLGMSPILS